jgi:hypothetical protein
MGGKLWHSEFSNAEPDMIIPVELYCGRGIGFRPSMNLIFCGVGVFEVANTEYGKRKRSGNTAFSYL